MCVKAVLFSNCKRNVWLCNSGTGVLIDSYCLRFCHFKGQDKVNVISLWNISEVCVVLEYSNILSFDNETYWFICIPVNISNQHVRQVSGMQPHLHHCHHTLRVNSRHYHTGYIRLSIQFIISQPATVLVVTNPPPRGLHAESFFYWSKMFR